MPAALLNDIEGVFIGHGDGTPLVITGRKQLHHGIPKALIIGFQVFIPHFIQGRNYSGDDVGAFRFNVVSAEVFQREAFGRQLVHGAATVRRGANLVGVELFPPIQGGP